MLVTQFLTILSLGATSTFIVQTEDELLMWDSAPWTPKEWTAPRERIRLVQSRIICNDDPILDPANPKRSCRITIRYGSDHGVACYTFCLTTR